METENLRNIREPQKSSNNVEIPDFASIFNSMNQLDSKITNTLSTVNTASSNLLDEIEFIVHGQKSEKSLPIERESAHHLINLKEESVQLLNLFSKRNTPQLGEAVNFGSIYKHVEDLERFSDENNEFNRYLKMISQGIKKMASNNSPNYDSSHLGSLSSTFLSADFSLGNPVASSPFSSSVFKQQKMAPSSSCHSCQHSRDIVIVNVVN